MRMMWAIATAAITLSGCATVPAQRFEVQSSRYYSKPYDDAWAALVRHFAVNQIGIRTIEKDSGLIVADSEVNSGSPGAATSDRTLAQGRIQDLADCGKDPTTLPYGYVIRLNVLARPELGGTLVTVNAQYRLLAASPNLFGPPTLLQRTCNSTGVLERAILDAVG